jgi:hypothetical protein
MTAPTLDGVDMGTVMMIRDILSTNIVQLPLPTQGADSAETFDLLGVTDSIEVSGFYIGATVAAVKSQIDALKALADKVQESVNFVSDQTGTKSVKIGEVSVTWDNLTSFRADYVVRLLIGV